MKGLDLQRHIMIRDHLVGRGIRDPAVLAAMEEVPRERFVPDWIHDAAYEDRPLSIEEGQTISQPYIVAYMAEVLELTPRDRVLEIGTGSGYAAAVLSRIVSEVYTVERLALLARCAGERLARLGYDNIRILEGDGTLGWSEHAPYDAVQVTAGAPHLPQPLMAQLAVGGRMVIPVGRDTLWQTLVRVRRTGPDEYMKEHLLDVRFVPLIGEAGW